MHLSRSGARQRGCAVRRVSGGEAPEVARPQPMVTSWPSGSPIYSAVKLGSCLRLSLMLTPRGRGSLAEQVTELLEVMGEALAQQSGPAAVITQTIFLRDASDRAACEELLSKHYGSLPPVTNFVYQPPCCGAALALEALAIAGASAGIERFGLHAVAVSFDSVRWVYCAGVQSANNGRGCYPLTRDGLERLAAILAKAGSGLEHVVRTWFYLGSITKAEGQSQRYKELNRARTEFYRNIRFCRSLSEPMIPQAMYPASTAIGMAGMGLVASCLTVQTDRKDAFLVALENPQQTPAYAYPRRHSPKSPKFSRGVALVFGTHAVTWVSGTASIVNSESRHCGDIQKQTEQAIENIGRLIAPDNFAFHRVSGVGAGPGDLAKIRVYVKRPEDFVICKSICEEHFGAVPAIYAIADICRPELLVEIEGVAFSRNSHASAFRGSSTLKKERARKLAEP
jgi:enamine deaminase RidA (YjgF/YER057c/UK114 family)